MYVGSRPRDEAALSRQIKVLMYKALKVIYY
jgi:hypothetical protein